jgi:hypothetical protein
MIDQIHAASFPKVMGTSSTLTNELIKRRLTTRTGVDSPKPLQQRLVPKVNPLSKPLKSGLR